MTVERYIWVIAGTFVLVSLALGAWVNHNWYGSPPLWGRIYFSRASRSGA